MTRKRQKLVALLLGFSVLAAACSSSGTESEESDSGNDVLQPGSSEPATESESDSAAEEPVDATPIVVGHTAGETGFMAVFDLPIRQGIEMAIDDINASGGVLGRPLELVTSNNETDFTKLQSAALEVIEQGADFVIPSCDFDVGGPAARIANENGLIAIGCAGGPLFGVEGIGPLTYNMYSGSPAEGALLAEFALAQGYEKPYVLTDESLEYSLNVGDFFAQRWNELVGTDVAGRDLFLNSDESIAAQVSRIRDADIDVIVVASYPPGGAAALRQLVDSGIDLPMLGAQAFDGTYWLDAVPGLTDFTIPVYGSLYGDDPSPERTEFFSRFEERFGEPPASAFYSLSGYSSVQAMAIAIERAGVLDALAVAAELDAFTDEPLLVGPTTFTAECHISTGRPLLLVEYNDGSVRVVDQRGAESVPDAPC